MLRNRSGRLMAIMFAGSFVLAGAGGCIGAIGGDDEAETDRETTAGGHGTGRDNTGADGRSGGRTGRDGATGASGRQGGRESGRQSGERAGYQGGRQGGGGQRAGSAQNCGEQAGYQGGRQGGGQAGYRGGRQGGGQAGYQGGRQGGGHSAMRQPSDREIVMLVSIINQREVELSEIARDKAESPEVQRYAEQMIDEHSHAQQHGAELSSGATTNIEACSHCKQLQTDAAELKESLQDQEGAEFDVAFIWAQISLHRQALELLDESVVEGVRDARLRSHVTALRGDIEQHLRRAEQMFCSLLQERQQQSGPQKSAQQQGAQFGQQATQQRGQLQRVRFGQQSTQQRGQQQGAELQGPQQRGQQQGAQFGQQSTQQRGQQQGAELQGPQQRGQQQGAQFGQQATQQRGQQQGAQFGQQAAQQRGQQQGAQFGQQSAQQQGPQSAQQQGPQRYAQQQEAPQKSR
ncbi:DUF4142 domain-containing protein [Sorangium sp. So ce388]|uniref:DUF4142 domain-containing protein n=1 Tax=Sorangium sp. So ce388 TaxID=3133309 RepID=UPI003F5BAF2A